MRAKRFISVILSILIVCSSFAGLTVFADEANENERTKDVAPVGADVSDKYSVATSDEAVQDQSGTTGDCTWTYVASTQTLTISGNGKTGDYYWYDECPWYDFSKSIKEIVIENGVTSIGEYTFYGCTNLTSVTIPDSVTSIGYRAFYDCTSLTNITIPDSVTCIEESAFSCCDSLIKIEVNENNQAYSSLNGDLYDKTQIKLIQYAIGKKDKSFTIPNSVTNIGKYACYGCTGLTSVAIGNSVTDIGYSAFSYCTGLETVNIGGSINLIPDYAFSGCTALTSVTIPNNVTSIRSYAFSGCSSLSDIIIPDSVTSIGTGAFRDCTCLTSIKIPDSVKSIGYGLFYSCISLNSVIIPNKVEGIGEWAFGYCTSLTDVTIPDSVINIGDYSFSYCTSLTDVTIPDSVTYIGDKAFYNCTSLSGVTIPSNVASIGDHAFGYYYDYDNHSYKKIEGFTIYGYNDTLAEEYAKDNGFTFASLGDVTEFSGTTGDCKWTCYIPTNTLTVSGNGMMKDYEWYNECPWYNFRDKINKVVIENGVTNIGAWAFYGFTSLTDVTIPDSVTSIGDFAFSSCTSLTGVTIPNSVTSIGDSAFSGCKCLTKIEVDENNKTYSSLNGNLYDKSQTELIQYAVGKEDISFKIPDSVTSIGNWAFSHCTSLTGVTIGDSVTSIGKGAFDGCTSLTSITISDSVTIIKDYAFCECTSLTDVTIPDSVTSIEYRAFDGCTSLTSVTIPSNVTSIGNRAFGYYEDDIFSSEKVEGFTIYGYNDTLAEIYAKDNGFSFVSLGDVTEFSGVTGDCIWTYYVSTNTLAVSGKGKMTDYEWEGECPWYKFNDKIKKVVIENGVSNIGNYAFSDCTSLTGVTIGDSVTRIGNQAFLCCTSLTGVYITDIANWCEISFSSYSSNPLGYAGKLYLNNELVTDVTISDGVKYIENYSFEGCTSLTSVTIPESVTSIEFSAFSGCTGLTNVTFSNSVICIDEDAFLDCTSLTSVTIPDTVTDIGDYAFGYYYDGIDKEKVKDFTIYGYKGTSAEAYANDNEFNFVSLGIAKSEQTITGVESKYDVTYGDKPFNLNAKAETALSYVSDNTSVAEVSSDGIVTIKGAGKATITITAEETASYKSATTSVEITVNKASQEVSVDKLDYKLTYGAKSFNLNAKAETELSYISDNTSVADVSADGTVTIKGAGTATITITAEETANYNSATATVEITVGKASQEVTGFESKYDVTFGDKPFNLNAKAETSLSYTSDNTSVAEVSADGTVTIKGAGKATITITAEETANYNSATATVEITVNKVGQEVSVDKQNYKLTYGAKSFSLNAKAETTLSYVSSNPKVAYVSADGTVTIKGAGTATITITAEEAGNYTSATATVKITVAKATQRVTGVKSQYVTSAGKSFNLNAKAKSKLTYTSSNKNVAVVSSTGKVTVKAGGYAYITVKASENGNYKSAYVKTKIISVPRDFTSKDVSKVKKTGKTTAKITWKSLAGATGYTVQLATNKTFKGAKTVKNSKNTANFTNLKKGKTYYVRINAYTKVSGKNYSNKWYIVKFKM
ncbi:MAG: leucine-rich repeat protein [Oscillospiraceae bacterium]|nr:leucine-rich repeat protein [Oscillospiraceae bacterium]